MTTLKQEYLGKLKELVKWLDQERPSMNSVFGDILGANLLRSILLNLRLSQRKLPRLILLMRQRKDMIIGKLMEGELL